MALTKAQEYDLGLKIKEYRESEEVEKKEKYNEALEAFIELYDHNQDLAHKQAYKFVRDTNAIHYDIEDALQDARMALMNAIWRYDPTKGAKVSTFSYMYIFKALTHNSNLNRRIQLNDTGSGVFLKVRKAKEKYAELKPDMEEREFILQETKVPLATLIALENAVKERSSLSFVLSDDNSGASTTLGDVIPDETTAGARFESGFTVETEGLLSLLPEEEQIYLRYEFNDWSIKKPIEDFLEENNLTIKQFNTKVRGILKKLRALANN